MHKFGMEKRRVEVYENNRGKNPEHHPEAL